MGKTGTRFALYVGFFAGVIWGGLKTSEYFLKFTAIPLGFLIEPFYKHAFLATWKGMVLGGGAFILFSMAAAVIYYAVLRKAKGPYYGIGYGVLWWLLLYLLLGPLSGMVPPLAEMDLNSNITDGCLFILWGLFIGYSITFEYTNEQSREPGIF
jgi:uncharacterized membrane protein YagU involved in acid resistance